MRHPTIGSVTVAGRFMPEKVKILIVEDNMPFAMLAVELLRADCEVAVATTVKKAMQMAEEGNFDLITLDVDLSDGNGFNLCSRLKEHPRLCNTPVVFVSARCLIEDQQRGLDVGAADYITKPFETFEFAPRLLSHIKVKRDFNYVAESENAMA